jgi:hypothetical protein
MATLYGPSVSDVRVAATWRQEKTLDAQAQFLAAYATLGTKTAAANVASVTLRTVDYWLTNDVLGFREQFRVFGEQTFKDNLEAVLLERARDETVKNPAYLLTAVRGRIRDVYGTIDVNVDDQSRAREVWKKLAEGIGRFSTPHGAIDTTSRDATKGASEGTSEGVQIAHHDNTAASDGAPDLGAAE